MSKILFCASTTSHIRNFHLPYIKALREQGYKVWVATDKKDDIPYVNYIQTFPFKKRYLSWHNISSIFQMRKFLIEQKIEKISIHTALASTIVRLAILTLPKKLRPQVFYIAHGYLFHENDGSKKWLYLLPEIICSSVTDTLIVMNKDDWEIANKYHLYNKHLYFSYGIGIDLSSFKPFSPEKKIELRQTYGFSANDVLFVFAGDFSARKNQEFLIRAFAKISSQYPQAHLLLAGNGVLFDKCKSLVENLNMTTRIRLLGHVKQIQDLYPLCDVAVSASKTEGLPFNIMEAMACGLPVLVSNIKGHRDLVENKEEFLFHTEHEFLEKLQKYIIQPPIYHDWSSILSKCSLQNVMPQLMEIYAPQNPHPKK